MTSNDKFNLIVNLIIIEEKYGGKAGSASVEGFRYTHLTLLPASRDASSPNGHGEPLIQAEMAAANKFSEIAMRYNVSGVAQTNINDSAGVILGAVDEDH